MRGRLALAFVASLALHGGILAWAGRRAAPPRRATVEVEFVRVETAAPPGDGASESGPGAEAAAEPQRDDAPARHTGRSAPTKPAVPRPPAGSEGPDAAEEASDVPVLPTRAAAEDGEEPAPAPANATAETVVGRSAEEVSTTVVGAAASADAGDGEPTDGTGRNSGAGQGDGAKTGSGAGSGGGDGTGGGTGAGTGRGTGAGDPHAALHAHLRRHASRCYPPLARRRGIEGTVGLSFCIDESGMPYRLQVETSSGSSLLDRAAVSCVVEEAAPLPALPGCVRLDVPFRLR